MTERQYDIVIWGATGFTGRLVLDYMANAHSGGNLRWAVAGRSREKLESVLEGRSVDVLVADSEDPTSIEQLVRQARVILTTVGPYARYGSILVEMCARYGTHYCDLTGEVHWMRRMIEQHEAAAIESGARIVHTCGFDSIPSDLGVFFLQKEMRKRHGVPARQIKYRVKESRGGVSGGTVDSMMVMMEEAAVDSRINQIIADPYALNFRWRGKDGADITGPVFDADFGGWVGPFVMAAVNTRVVRRTNELLDFAYGEDFAYDEAMLMRGGIAGYMGAAAIAMGTGAMTALAATGTGRGILKRMLPKPGEGPTTEQIESGGYEIELLARHPQDRSRDLRAMVKGDRDPGYGSTSKMLAECALCLAQDELQGGGGIWTPAALMGDQLLERLPASAGVTFEMLN